MSGWAMIRYCADDVERYVRQPNPSANRAVSAESMRAALAAILGRLNVPARVQSNAWRYPIMGVIYYTSAISDHLRRTILSEYRWFLS